MRHVVSSALRRALASAGFDVRHRAASGDARRNELERLRALPSVPTIIDVGIGHLGTPALWKRFEGAQFLLIDPLEECAAAAAELLADPKNKFVAVAAGAEPGTLTINVAQTISRSSIHDRTALTQRDAPKERRRIEVRPLDQIVAEAKAVPPFGLKIDTEGHEYEVLKGATETIRLCKFLIIEVRYGEASFHGSYEFSDLMRLTHEHGFIPSRVLRANNRFADMVFEPIRAI